MFVKCAPGVDVPVVRIWLSLVLIFLHSCDNHLHWCCCHLSCCRQILPRCIVTGHQSNYCKHDSLWLNKMRYYWSNSRESWQDVLIFMCLSLDLHSFACLRYVNKCKSEIIDPVLWADILSTPLEIAQVMAWCHLTRNHGDQYLFRHMSLGQDVFSDTLVHRDTAVAIMSRYHGSCYVEKASHNI